MRYLITGATGDVGSRVVKLLLGRGERPRIFARDAILSLSYASAEPSQGLAPIRKLAAELASPVYVLLGKKGLSAPDFPPMETGALGGNLAFRQHSGGHTPGPNWPTFIEFAARYFTATARTGGRGVEAARGKGTRVLQSESPLGTG